MILIRQSQMQVFEAESKSRFEQDLVWHFLNTYPRECRQAGGPEAVGNLVSDALERASVYGFKSRAQVSLFVALRFILGRDFDKDPQIPWAGQLLSSRSIPNPSLRINAVYDQMLEYLQATAGQKCGLVVRAMIRLRDWDLSTAPAVDAHWDANMLQLLQGIYPEKFEYQGEQANRFLLDDAIAKCDFFYSLYSPQGRGLVTILMFMLGSGFDRDQLHPWAARILMDSKISKEADRVAALYAAARAHLQESLASNE